MTFLHCWASTWHQQKACKPKINGEQSNGHIKSMSRSAKPIVKGVKSTQGIPNFTSRDLLCSAYMLYMLYSCCHHTHKRLHYLSAHLIFIQHTRGCYTLQVSHFHQVLDCDAPIASPANTRVGHSCICKTALLNLPAHSVVAGKTQSADATYDMLRALTRSGIQQRGTATSAVNSFHITHLHNQMPHLYSWMECFQQQSLHRLSALLTDPSCSAKCSKMCTTTAPQTPL